MALLCACLVFQPLSVLALDGLGTQITGLHVSVKGNLTRLTFDMDGAKPRQMGPPSTEAISIFFNQMTAKIPDKKISNTAAAAAEVKFRREGGFLEVLFREKNTTVVSRIIAGKKQRYSILLELWPPSRTGSAEAPKEKAIPPEALKRVDSADLFGLKVTADQKNPPHAEDKKKQERISERPSASKATPFVEADPRTLDLFQSADDKFENCRRNLVLCGPEVIEAYSEALKTGAKSSRAPVALYRIGLAHWTMGSFSKAERFFQQVISEWPENPASSRCWVGLGDIYNKKQSPLEAMEAFRAALRVASDKTDKAAAYFELGRQFFILGVPKEALDTFGLCSAQDPEYYMKRPEVLRLLGETEFALGHYDKSKEHLLRYINLNQSAPDQDMVYAKLAEIMVINGDTGLANKMYAFIRKYYTDTEGDYISRIRYAELNEKNDLEKSLRTYDELCSKELSPNLKRIVYFKLAALNWRKGNLERGLELIEDVLQGKTSASTSVEITSLRDKILVDLVKKQFVEKNFTAVAQLHDRYRRVFDTLQHANDTLESIAESYGALKLYPNALELYEKLTAKGYRKGEEHLLKYAVYALRIGDSARASQFCKQVQAEALDCKKSEIMGHVSYRDQKNQDAVKFFGKAFQKNKEFDLTDPDSYYAYAYALHDLKRYEEVVPVVQKGLDRIKANDSDHRRAMLVMLGKSYAELKQPLKAAETMELALQFAGEDQASELRYETSKLYLVAGQQEKAMQNLNQLVGAANPFWAVVAQQQLNSIQMSR